MKMNPTQYLVYQREERSFVRKAESLESIQMPDPSDEAAWQIYLRHIQAAGAARIKAEVARLNTMNFLDQDGRDVSNTWPPDMLPTSETSTTTG